MDKPKPKKLLINFELEQGDEIHHDWKPGEPGFRLWVTNNGENVSRPVSQLLLYQREKKPKIIHHIRYRRPSHFSARAEDALALYEQVWAIDTNRRDAFDVTMNVAAVCALDPEGESKPKDCVGLAFGKVKGNPELFAWRKFIEFLLQNEIIDPSKRYALVVDSELNRIDELNRRTMPIHSEFILPNNFDLIYATADAGRSLIFNKALRRSDKLATVTLGSISKLAKNALFFQNVEDEDAYRPEIFVFQTLREYLGAIPIRLSPEASKLYRTLRD
ncbi:hypothetical protein LRC39_11390 [Rhodopseudomonas sp. P1]|uniref:hypothetical protein n=1 Tax=Rhodopseudomonas sp. P1 TaxID=3434357 RepID=UPI0031FDD187